MRIDVAAKLRKADELVRLWGIDSFQNRELPLYWEARKSSRPQIFDRIRKRYAKVEKQFPENLGLAVTSKFNYHDEGALSKHLEAIKEAAICNDADFFISLGKVLAKRKKKTLVTMETIPQSTTDADLVLEFWTRGLLWLMSDNAALQFFKNVVGVPMGLQAFQKTRGRLRLVKLDPPVISKVEVSALAVTEPNSVSAFYDGQYYTLYFKRGWSLAQTVSGGKPS